MFTSSKAVFIAATLLISAVFSIKTNALPFPANESKWTDQDKQEQRNAADKMLKELHDAIKNGKNSYSITKGVYRFDKTSGTRKTHIHLLGVKNFTIEGNNSLFYFENFDTGIQIYKSENLVLKNLYLDWDPLPFTQGKVIAIDEKSNSFTFQADKGYEKLYDQLFESPRNRGMLFDKSSRKMKAGQTGFCLKVTEKLSDDTYQVKVSGFYKRNVKQCGIEKGDLIAMFARMGRAVKVEVSSKITLENITLYSAPFIGFVENVGNGGNVYRKCSILIRPGTDRLIGGNADGFNCSGTLQGPVIEDCRIENIGDDFINIHGVYFRIFEQVSSTELIVQPFGSNGVEIPEISILENNTWALKGKRKVTSRKNFTYTIPESSKEALKHRWAAAMNYKPGSKISASRITLDQPLGLTSPAIFSCDSANANGTVIKNCHFTGSLARGIRFQSKHAVIENNVVDRCLGPGLTTAGQPGFWGEAVTSANLKIIGNTFSECSIGGMGRKHVRAAVMITAPGTLATAETAADIVLSGNKIIRPGDNAMFLDNCVDITIKNNVFQEVGVNPPSNNDPLSSPILTGATKNVQFTGNKFIQLGKFATKSNIEAVK